MNDNSILNQEIWKDIVKYEGLYQVSNFGNVRSLDKKIVVWNHAKQDFIISRKFGQLLKPQLKKSGYYQVNLYKIPRKYTSFPIHRLVAIAFLTNADNLPEVHHKNSVRTDNRVENLEWVTKQRNGFYKWKRIEPTQKEKLVFYKLQQNKRRSIHTQKSDVEFWRDIPGYENYYQASNWGKIKSLDRINIINRQGHLRQHRGRILKPKIDKDGYESVCLCLNSNSQKHFRVHRLIALTFINNPHNLPVVNHINGIKDDNYIENLEWNSLSDNMSHALKTGLRNPIMGEDCDSSKLTEEQVVEIRKYYKSGIYSQKDLADKFQVSCTAIINLLAYKTWKHIG